MILTNTFSKVGKQLFLQEILKAEKQLDISLPKDYVDFLLKFNGGIPLKTLFYLNFPDYPPLGRKIDFFSNLEEAKQSWLYQEEYLRELSVFPIATDIGNGSICIGFEDTKTNNIFSYTGDFDLVFLANSLEEFVNGLQ